VFFRPFRHERGRRIFFFAFVETLYQGQVDALVLLLWVMGIYFVDSKAPIWSAFCFALATMIKVSPVLAVGIFLLRRQWRWLIAYALWMGAFLGVGVWQVGWQNHVLWFSRVLPMLSGGVPYFASKSLPTLVVNLYLRQVPLDVRNLPSIPAALVSLTKGLSLTLYLGTLFYFWKRCPSAKNLVHELAVISLVILLTVTGKLSPSLLASRLSSSLSLGKIEGVGRPTVGTSLGRSRSLQRRDRDGVPGLRDQLRAESFAGSFIEQPGCCCHDCIDLYRQCCAVT